MIAIRSMVNLCISIDHRILDGLQTGKFIDIHIEQHIRTVYCRKYKYISDNMDTYLSTTCFILFLSMDVFFWAIKYVQ